MIVVWGASYVSPTVSGWFGTADSEAATIGGFLYVTVASIAAGMLVSAVRWLLVDTLHHRTGVTQPRWDFGRLQDHHAAFQTIVEHQYRHYQFYANGLVSVAFLFVTRRAAVGGDFGEILAESAAFAAVGILCFVASRDNLRKYYERTTQMLNRGGMPDASPRSRGRGGRGTRRRTPTEVS